MENKIGLIISREYLTRVKKKSFLLATILVPVIIIAFYAVIIAIGMKGSTERQKLAVIDEASLLSDSAKNSDMVFIKNETEATFTKKYKAQGYDAFLYIPPVNIDSPANIVLHTPSSASIPLLVSTEKKLNAAIENKRLAASGINAAAYKKIASDISIQTQVDSASGSKKSVAGIATGVAFLCGMLIYLMMIIYGTQVMRGVSEEKTSRIAEVIVSSVKPIQLMIGKIIGIGAVGLTQFAIWILIMLAAHTLFAGRLMAAGGDGFAQNISVFTQGLSALPLLKIGLSFMFYFLGGYLLYASLFAAVGSMATDDQQDTQQLVFPILMPIILGFVIMTKAIADPNSSLAVFGSIFPLTSPIVMMGRMSFDVPAWQIAASMALLGICFLFFAWLGAKIYRTGILMYGKKPSWKEMIKWAVKKT